MRHVFLCNVRRGRYVKYMLANTDHIYKIPTNAQVQMSLPLLILANESSQILSASRFPNPSEQCCSSTHEETPSLICNLSCWKEVRPSSDWPNEGDHYQFSAALGVCYLPLHFFLALRGSKFGSCLDLKLRGNFHSYAVTEEPNRFYHLPGWFINAVIARKTFCYFPVKGKNLCAGLESTHTHTHTFATAVVMSLDSWFIHVWIIHKVHIVTFNCHFTAQPSCKTWV